MRIINADGVDIINPDLTKGRLVPDRAFVAHHEAVEAVAGHWHYETVKEFPNGGKEVKKVWDVEPVEGRAAWDEYEDVQRYIPYTPEELAAIEAERNKPQPPTLEELAAENERLSALLEYVAMMADVDIEEV